MAESAARLLGLRLRIIPLIAWPQRPEKLAYAFGLMGWALFPEWIIIKLYTLDSHTLNARTV
jgi:hypothetical protein